MAVYLQFLPVNLAFLAQIRVVRVWSQHDRIALGGGPADRLWRTGRDPGGRMGLLERFRQDLDILPEARMAFLRRHAEYLEFRRVEPPASPPVDSTTGEHVK